MALLGLPRAAGVVFPLFLLLLLQVQRASALARATIASWHIPVYVRVKATRVLTIDAARSTFIFEGTLQYAWRDDSLFDSMDDGEVYEPEEGGNGAPSNFSVVTRTGFVLIPKVTPDPLFVTSVSYNKLECVARARGGAACAGTAVVRQRWRASPTLSLLHPQVGR